MKKTQTDKYFLYIIFATWLLIPMINVSAAYLWEGGFFVFRAWEVVTRGRTQGPFASSIVFEKTIYGDLANMLKVRKFRQYRHQIFTTDSYGFRNYEASEDSYYPIVVLGDSDMAGSSLSDNDTFSTQLGNLLGVRVYNYAPASPIHFLGDLRFMNNPPKVVVWENIERTLMGSTYRRYTQLPDNPKIQIQQTTHNQNTRFSTSRFSTQLARNIFQEIRYYTTGIKPESISFIHEESKMLFYTPGVNQLSRTNNDRDIQGVVDGIKHIQRILQSKGISLIFLPLPDKANTYKDMLPITARKNNMHEIFLNDLSRALSKQKISNINIYNLYNALLDKEDYLYFKDDTHWNRKGVQVAAEAVAKYIHQNELLYLGGGL